MPDKVRALLSEGFSKVACAAKLGICRDTLNVWEKEYPDFSDAIKEGEAASELWWEDKYRDQAIAGELSPAMMIFIFKTRFGYKETSAIEHTGNLIIENVDEYRK